MRLLLHGAGFANKGAEALLATATRELRRRLSAATFWIEPRHVAPAARGRAEALGVQLAARRPLSRVQGAWHTVREMGARPAAARRTFRTRHDWLHTAALLLEVDAVVDIAGYAYGDAWGTDSATDAERFFTLARRLHKPCIFMPQAWGPFAVPQTRAAYRRICRPARVIYARDEVSRGHLAGLLGDRAPIGVAPDIAICLEPQPADVGRRVLADAGLSAGPCVGVLPSRQVLERRGDAEDLAHSEYLGTLVAICRALRHGGARVVLLPHEIVPDEGGRLDDRALCRHIADAVRDPGVVALTDNHDAGTLKAVIGQLDAVVASRYHALIAALSQGIPALAIGWSHKYAELLRQFGLSEFARAHDGADRAAVVADSERLLADGPALRARIAERLPGVRGEVAAVFDAVAAALAAGI